MHVEQAFGIMFARWGILWRPLRFSLAQNVRVVQLAMVLHNFCIDNQDTNPTDMLTDSDVSEITSYVQTLSNSSQCLPGRSLQRRTSDLREKILSIIEERGIKRPGIA